MQLQRNQITKITITLFLIAHYLGVSAQQTVKFSKQVLTKPIEYAATLDSLFTTQEIPLFIADTTHNCIRFPNGYAQHQLHNADSLMGILATGAMVTHVNIVFTKYPINKKDWITNYYTLLSNRLQALFSIDSTLNSNTITWGLTLQTSAKNGSEAEQLFHGIEITYTPKPATPASIPNNTGNTEAPQVTEIAPPQQYYTPIEHLTPDPRFEQQQPRKNVKQKKRKEPKCPDITTRLKKPKRSIFSRIFRR